MTRSVFLTSVRQHLTISASLVALMANLGTPLPAAAEDGHRHATATPIKHVIVIIGENRTFDHVFATYKPRRHESVSNLLSKGIVNEDGTPGPNFSLASQSAASDAGVYQLSPSGNTPYAVLPPVLAGGYSTAPFPDAATAMQFENGLLPEDYVLLTTGGTGLAHGAADTRIPNAASLPNGPFQLTSSTHPYDTYDNSPVHRFYQMWQQFDCNAANATRGNPSGCKNDLWPWVEDTIGAGSNGNPQPAGFTDTSTREGSTSMGFYNMLQGDAPYFKYLADHYAMSDNFHQAVMGGTGANHVMLGTGDAIWFSDGNGNAVEPPHNVFISAGPNSGTVDEIENPNPLAGTNNWYTEDGYGRGSFGSPSSGGGTYSNCSDTSRSEVAAITNYLASLSQPIKANCDPGHYYLLNNYNPGYLGDGTSAYTSAVMSDPGQTVFAIPPSSLRGIGDALAEKKISFAYYGDQWNTYLANPDNNYVTADNTFCNICDFFLYQTSMMSSAAGRAHNLDTIDLYTAIQNGTLPAVSYVKPDGWLDGHPASSKLNLLEGFVKKIVTGVQANEELWDSTAIIVTFDEGGGYYDSGYIQPLDYFGDGTRIPTLVVSKYTRPGHISHAYADHVSILKFIEANWKLSPLTARSRDNYPNPIASEENPYVPLNSPAISDMMDAFDFHHD
ncbi:MAG TPA: alkaline phosphatase family protein [Candidatus Sulfotelmatobacter sp.]|nr:alkaline phosphatase family protein [Candidatus Sulfotelmatobacter sp.]